MTLATDLPLLLPIAALLPLTALLLVGQSNPYQSLILRGILGGVASLLYALLGAADVALTEALVGTLLSTTLYAVALRSSMVLRLACRDPHAVPPALKNELLNWLKPTYLRLELVPSPVETSDGSPQMPSCDCHGVLEWQPEPNVPIAVSLSQQTLKHRLSSLAATVNGQPLVLRLKSEP